MTTPPKPGAIRDPYLLLFGEKEEKVLKKLEGRTPITNPTDRERWSYSSIFSTLLLVAPPQLLRDHRDPLGIYTGIMAAWAMGMAHTRPEWNYATLETESIYPRLWDRMLNPPEVPAKKAAATGEPGSFASFVEPLFSGKKIDEMSPDELESLLKFGQVVGENPDDDLPPDILDKGLSMIFNMPGEAQMDPYAFSLPAFTATLKALGMNIPQDVYEHVRLYDWRNRIGLEKLVADGDMLRMMWQDPHAFLHRVKLSVKTPVDSGDTFRVWPLSFFPV